jgi:hypothetical protein
LVFLPRLLGRFAARRAAEEERVEAVGIRRARERGGTSSGVVAASAAWKNQSARRREPFRHGEDQPAFATVASAS